MKNWTDISFFTASSRIKNRICDKSISPPLINSSRRPGVATMISTPWCNIRVCSPTATPPIMTSSLFYQIQWKKLILQFWYPTELEDYLNIFEMIEFDWTFVELILEKATKIYFYIVFKRWHTSIIIANGAFGGRCFAAAWLPIPLAWDSTKHSFGALSIDTAPV